MKPEPPLIDRLLSLKEALGEDDESSAEAGSIIDAAIFELSRLTVALHDTESEEVAENHRLTARLAELEAELKDEQEELAEHAKCHPEFIEKLAALEQYLAALRAEYDEEVISHDIEEKGLKQQLATAKARIVELERSNG